MRCAIQTRRRFSAPASTLVCSRRWTPGPPAMAAVAEAFIRSSVMRQGTNGETPLSPRNARLARLAAHAARGRLGLLSEGLLSEGARREGELQQGARAGQSFRSLA